MNPYEPFPETDDDESNAFLTDMPVKITTIDEILTPPTPEPIQPMAMEEKSVHWYTNALLGFKREGLAQGILPSSWGERPEKGGLMPPSVTELEAQEILEKMGESANPATFLHHFETIFNQMVPKPEREDPKSFLRRRMFQLAETCIAHLKVMEIEEQEATEKFGEMQQKKPEPEPKPSTPETHLEISDEEEFEENTVPKITIPETTPHIIEEPTKNPSGLTGTIIKWTLIGLLIQILAVGGLILWKTLS